MKILLAALITIGIITFGVFFLSSDKEITETISESTTGKTLEKVTANASDANTQSSQLADTTQANKKPLENDTQEFDAVGDPIENHSRRISEELESRYRSISENDQYPTLSSRLSALDARRPNSNHSPEDVLSAMEKPAAWETKKEPGPNLKKLSQEELNDGRQFVDFDPLKVETLMPGDHMDVAVDSIGQVFDMRVDKVRIYEDDNVMWKGTIMNGDGGSVTITQSYQITVAAVVLPEDDFTLEAHGTDGWIVDSGTLFKVDPSHTDEVYSEEEHH